MSENLGDRPFHPAKVTRVRVEVSGPDRNNVVDLLVMATADYRVSAGGEWEVEEDDIEVQTTKGGYWGRMTIRRKE